MLPGTGCASAALPALPALPAPALPERGHPATASSEQSAALAPEDQERTGPGQGRSSGSKGGAVTVRGRPPGQPFSAVVRIHLPRSEEELPTDHCPPGEAVSSAFAGWIDSGPQTGPGVRT